MMALIKASPNGEHEPAIRGAVEWLNGHRGGWGQWGSTQGTVLSLKAMSAYAEHSRQTQASGAATLIVNGREVGTISFEKGHRDALAFDDFASVLTAGKNTIELRLAGDASLPYSIAIEYRSQTPQSSDAAKVSVTTSIAKSTVALGEGVRMRAKIVNKVSKDGVPMTLARIGIPGGLTFQTWQLKELRDKKIIDFYETRPREVIVYFRALAPGATKDVDLDLLAAVPGTYVAPASSAYLYYTDEHKTWAPPVSVTVK
jgi:hypothetical protein